MDCRVLVLSSYGEDQPPLFFSCQSKTLQNLDQCCSTRNGKATVVYSDGRIRVRFENCLRKCVVVLFPHYNAYVKDPE